MKRFFLFLALLLVLCMLGQTRAFAVSEQDIYEACGADKLSDAKQEENGFADSIWQTLGDAATLGIPKALKSGALIVAALIVISVFNSLKQSKGEDMGAAFDFVSAAVLTGACFPALSYVFNYTKAAIEGFCGFTAALLPVTASLYAMGGNAAQSVAASGGLNLFLTVTELVNAKALLPLLSLGVALSLTGLLPGSEHIAPAASIVKNCLCVMLVFTFSLVSFVFYFQTAVAASADNLSYRTVRFAAGTFIPLIGGAVGDSARTVFGAVSSVKASVGVLGLGAMGTYILPPVVSAFLYKGVFAFSAFFARLCGLEKQSKFIAELGGTLGVCLALLISCSVVFSVISAVFLKSGVSV